MSPNCSGKLVNPRFIIVHYTAGGTFGGAKAWLCNPDSKASAHYLLGRDGEAEQLVPLNKCAWHAGESKYKGLTGLNKYSIGVELVAWGPLEKHADGLYYSATEKSPPIPAEEVHIGGPPNSKHQYWHAYTDEQLDNLRTLIKTLRHAYPSIEEVIGHRDVAGFRGKQDPWPLDLSKFQG